MPTANDSTLMCFTTQGTARPTERTEAHDDLGEQMHAMSKCSPGDATEVLEMLADPQPINDRAKAVYQAGLAQFAARFRVVE